MSFMGFRARPAALGLALATLVVLSAPATEADLTDGVTLGLNIRWRPATDRVVFSNPTSGSVTGPRINLPDLQVLRTRLTAEVANDRATRIFLMIQDSRILGDPPGATLARETNLGVHQAFLEIGRFFTPSLSLQAGRFEMNYGNQRLLGAVAWANQNRSFDGFRLVATNDSGTFAGDVFIVQTLRDISIGNDPVVDADLFGGVARFPKAKSQVLALYDYDRIMVGPDRRLERVTVAGYSGLPFAGAFDYVANLAYQFGTRSTRSDSVTTNKQDITAYLIAVEAAWSKGRNRLGIGVDYASGDDPSTPEFEAFNNLYYTGHKFRGFMDQFLLSNIEGLVDIYLTERIKLNKGRVLFDIHYFQTDQSFAKATDPMQTATNLGWEVDLKVFQKILPEVTGGLGGALFFASEDWQGKDVDPEAWAFLQLVVALPS